MTVRRAYVAIGGNLGPVHDTLQAAVAALRAMDDAVFVAASPWYDTAPIDAPGPDFVNGVVALDTALAPYPLLLRLLDLEARLGRERKRRRNAPRPVDLDLLLLGALTMRSAPLTLPHPRLHERAFALQPLLDLAPDLVVPGRGPVADLLRGLGEQRLARRSDSGADSAPR